jgi:hypothetical protein
MSYEIEFWAPGSAPRTETAETWPLMVKAVREHLAALTDHPTAAVRKRAAWLLDWSDPWPFESAMQLRRLDVHDEYVICIYRRKA